MEHSLAWCSQCKQYLEKTLFSPDKSRPSGCRSYCKACAAARRVERYANDEEFREKEKSRVLARYHKDPEPLNKQRAKWARENREKDNAIHRRMHARHSEKWRTIWRDHGGRRRTAYRAADPETRAWIAQILDQPCFYCGLDGDIQVEHKIPLSRGGRHIQDNIVGACGSCNRRKGVMTSEEFMASEACAA